MAHPAFAETAHRPWPVPDGPWALTMTWTDLLFAHWPLAPEDVRPLVPACLDLDLLDGRAWVGVVPFRMSGVRLRALPPVPGAHDFPELNVRTYVRCAGRAGVFFWSLDAASRLVVRAARRWFRLPYFDAEMSLRAEAGGSVAYESRRTHRGAPAAGFAARYGPAGPEFRAAPDSLEAFLTERYALFSADGAGRPVCGEIHHVPWPLQPARAVVSANTMAAAAGLALPDAPPHLLFARRLDVAAWAPRRVR